MNDRFSMLRHDLSTALSGFRRRPMYAALAIGMMALGLAANVAVFTVISRTLLRRLPYRNPETLVSVFTTRIDSDKKREPFPSGSIEFVHWKTQTALLEQIEAARPVRTSISDRGEPEPIRMNAVSAGMFRLLGVSPAIGRDFTPVEDQPNAHSVIISHGLWQRRFAGDVKVLGRTVFVDGRPMSVVGVMPRDFEIPQNPADVFTPLGMSLANMPDPPNRYLTVLGRLRKGVSVAQAEADLARISRQLEPLYPNTHKQVSAMVQPLPEALYGNRRPALLTLLAAVLLVHLLACVNVANLILAQISDQQGTTAVRMALGAKKSQLIRFRLVESALIGVTGAVLGLVLGALTVRVLLHNYALPDLSTSAPETWWMVSLFLVGLTLLTTAGVSIVPALRESKVGISSIINEGSHRTSASVRGTRMRELFIIAEVALAVPLLIAGALTVKRFRDLQTVNLGFTPDHVLTGQLIMPARYKTREDRAAFARELVRRMEAIPGVQAAAITTCTFKFGDNVTTVAKNESMGDFVATNFRRITPRYFETMKTPLIAGRTFTDNDTIDSPAVVVVSQSFAKRFFPGKNAVGQKVFRTAPNPIYTIIGVAPDIRDSGVSADLGPTLYTSYYQANFVYLSVVARVAGDPDSYRKPLQRAVWSIDRNLALSDTIDLRQLVDDTLGAERLQVSLLGGFAIIAMILAAVGIYGVTSYSVSQRMREVGVRMAFGASKKAIVRELLGRASRSVGIGIVAGLLLAMVAVRLTTSFSTLAAEFDVRYAILVVLVLFTSSLLASFVPALRARNASPVMLLRDA